MRNSRTTTRTTKKTTSTTTDRNVDDARVPVALGLGANLGNPRDQLRTALRKLEQIVGPLRVASLYLTRPKSPIPQPNYLNTAAALSTDRSPDQLLEVCKALETAAGRTPGPRLAPRPLDIDILLYGSQIITRPGLTIPHPRLLQRRFALAPLTEIAADWSVPGTGMSVAEALRRVGQEEEVQRVEWGE